MKITYWTNDTYTGYSVLKARDIYMGHYSELLKRSLLTESKMTVSFVEEVGLCRERRTGIEDMQKEKKMQVT